MSQTCYECGRVSPLGAPLAHFPECELAAGRALNKPGKHPPPARPDIFGQATHPTQEADK